MRSPWEGQKKMNAEGHNVLIIGAAGLDIKVQPEAQAIESAQSNPAHIHWSWGGVARNIAENLGRLGVNVQFITAVGDDDSGEELLLQLHQVGVETNATLVITGQETASYVEILHHDKHLLVAFDDMQIIRAITPDYLAHYQYLFQQTDLICLDANLSLGAFRLIFKLAQRYAIPVCADPTTAALAPRLHPFLSQIAALTPNRQEAEALLNRELATPEGILQGARDLAYKGVELAIITQGAEGLSYATAEESGRLPPFDARVVDPTGTGDALTAAVAYGLLEELPPTEAAQLGLAAAAQTIHCAETVCPYITLESLYDQLVV
ncbi:MAG: carbohydrate kinase family protein [Chloroflexota bacterium]|nr:carbohydrate kinase family protein [Chloroflexota bacterium]